jgi:hypothetical protein
MKTQLGDEFIPPGVDRPSWLAFEGRVQQRRFRSLLENIESCIDQRDIASARIALDEARALRPDACELSRLEARLAGHGANAWSRDFHVWGRVITGASMLLAGVSLVLLGQSAPRSDTARRLAGNPAPTTIAASAPTPIRDSGRGPVATSDSVRDVPIASASPSDVPTSPVALPAPSASRVREAHTVSFGTRRPEPVEPVVTPSSQPFNPTESSAYASSPSLAPPLVSLRVTPATPTAGSPVSLTVTITIPTGDAAPRVTVDWGDGTNQDIGIVPTVRTVTHAYADAGDYAITASATWDGETSVNPRPASTLTVSQTPADVNANDARSVLMEARGAVPMTAAEERHVAAVLYRYPDASE